MFNDTKVQIFNTNFQETRNIYADVQPYEKSIIFEDGIEITITQRAFCEIVLELDECSYLRFNNRLFKVLKIKSWSDYLECWLYECERDIP